MNNKNKLFPKIQKKIKGFLTSESGKISKKDALGLAVGGMLIAGIDDTFAAVTGHINYTPKGHGNVSIPAGEITVTTKASGRTAKHASGIVNGHYSNSNPGINVGTCTADASAAPGHGSHASHGSHGSHASHGSHGSRW